MPVIFWPLNFIASLTIETLLGRKITIDQLFLKVGKNAGE